MEMVKENWLWKRFIGEQISKCSLNKQSYKQISILKTKKETKKETNKGTKKLTNTSQMSRGIDQRQIKLPQQSFH